jgi:hypothetical protein
MFFNVLCAKHLLAFNAHLVHQHSTCSAETFQGAQSKHLCGIKMQERCRSVLMEVDIQHCTVKLHLIVVSERWLRFVSVAYPMHIRCVDES